MRDGDRAGRARRVRRQERGGDLRTVAVDPGPLAAGRRPQLHAEKGVGEDGGGDV